VGEHVRMRAGACDHWGCAHRSPMGCVTQCGLQVWLQKVEAHLCVDGSQRTSVLVLPEGCLVVGSRLVGLQCTQIRVHHNTTLSTVRCGHQNTD
jgi:hypothetical protein